MMVDTGVKADPQQAVSLLLVEDNDTDARLVERLVRKLQCNVIITRARNGEEALRVILADSDGGRHLPPPVATLVDIKMPRMGGLELLAELDRRECTSPMGPLFMLTTSSNPVDRKVASSHPRVGQYLIKPLTRESLERVLAEALEHGS